MFGESDSESPRAGSPWDSFIAHTPSPKGGSNDEVRLSSKTYSPLKLVPEVEHGNVEYKLKLVNPSPERFTRLVTQLKWRLLEGGGQAYYELGVADSGHLVGLSRADLEASLETLEMMAGDIGASVVVIKEVEIPGVLPSGSGMNSVCKLPISKPDSVDGDARVTFANERITTSETTAGENSRIDGENTPRTHISDNEDASGSLGTIAPRIFLTHGSFLSPDSLINYDIEICTVYKPRPHRSRPLPVVSTKREAIGTNGPKLKSGKWVNFKARRSMRGDDTNEDRLAASSVGSGTELETPIPIVASSMDSILPKLNALALDAADIPSSDIPCPSVSSTPESRFIVEALVVRKLAPGEAFLDFNGFALNG